MFPNSNAVWDSLIWGLAWLASSALPTHGGIYSNHEAAAHELRTAPNFLLSVIITRLCSELRHEREWGCTQTLSRRCDRIHLINILLKTDGPLCDSRMRAFYCRKSCLAGLVWVGLATSPVVARCRNELASLILQQIARSLRAPNV